MARVWGIYRLTLALSAFAMLTKIGNDGEYRKGIEALLLLATSLLTCAIVSTPTNRGRLLAWVGMLGGGSGNECAAAISS